MTIDVNDSVHNMYSRNDYIPIILTIKHGIVTIIIVKERDRQDINDGIIILYKLYDADMYGIKHFM
jgi:hypothetical protein